MKLLISFALASIALFGQTTVNGGRTTLGPVDNSGSTSTKPDRNVTSNPATCSKGELIFNTTDTNTYRCTATNVLTQVNNAGAGINQLTGDVTAGPGTGSQAATLGNSGVTPGSCGDATHSCGLNIDAKGRITSQSNNAISGGGGSGGVNCTPVNGTGALAINFNTAGPAGVACTDIEVTLTGNVTSVALTGGTSRLSLTWIEGGTPFTVAGLAGNLTQWCAVPATASTTVIQNILFDATNYVGNGCVDSAGVIIIPGSSSGSVTIKVPPVAGSNTLTLPAGTTDFSATGGTSQVVKQTSVGAALTVGQLAATDLSNGVSGSGAVCLATGSACAPSLLSGTLASIPGTCTVGANLYQATDQPITLQVYACTATNTWTRQAYTQGTTAGKPGTCSVGQVYFATDATAGQNWFFCTATNTWTQQLNSGGGSTTAKLPIWAGTFIASTVAGGSTSNSSWWQIGGASGFIGCQNLTGGNPPEDCELGLSTAAGQNISYIFPWDSAYAAVDLHFVFGQSSTSAGNFRFTAQLMCNTLGTSIRTGTWTLGTASTTATIPAPGTANTGIAVNITSINIPICAPTSPMVIQLTRDQSVASNDADDARLYTGSIIVTRTLP